MIQKSDICFDELYANIYRVYYQVFGQQIGVQ